MRHALAGLGDWRVDIFEHLAAELFDLGLHPVRLGDGDLVGRVREDDDPGLSLGVDEGPVGGCLGNLLRIGRDVGRDAHVGDRSNRRGSVPGNHRDLGGLGLLHGGALLNRVEPNDSDAIGVECKCLAECGGAAVD